MEELPFDNTMKLAINGRITEATDFSFLEMYFADLRKRGIAFKVFEDYALKLNERECFHSHPLALSETYRLVSEMSDADCVLSIGGDGTLLETARRFINSGIPVL